MEDTGSKGGRKRRTNVKAPTAAASKAAAAKPAATTKATLMTKPAARRTGAKPDAAPARAAGPDRAELVRIAAYFRAERRGFAAGYEVEDWLAAEAEVAERLGSTRVAAAAKTTPRKPSKG